MFAKSKLSKCDRRGRVVVLSLSFRLAKHPRFGRRRVGGRRLDPTRFLATLAPTVDFRRLTSSPTWRKAGTSLSKKGYSCIILTHHLVGQGQVSRPKGVVEVSCGDDRVA